MAGMRLGRAIIAGTFVLAAVGATAACKDDPQQRGQIMLLVTTDVPLPESVDKIAVEVSTLGSVQFASDYEVGAGRLLVPATLGIVQGSDPGRPVLIRLIAKQRGTAKMLREVTTTIPERLALLRMPIRWLCDDSAKETAPGVFESVCPQGQTCIGGECRDSHIESNDNSKVPDYSEGSAFGGGTAARGDGSCFDPTKCIGTPQPATVDPATCSFPVPAGASPASLNVALVVGLGEGFACNATECHVFLDRDPLGLDGWKDEAGKIVLPPAVCRRITSGRVKRVVTTTTCPAKNDLVPLCGPFSSVNGPGSSGGNDAGSDSGGGGNCATEIEADCTHPGTVKPARPSGKCLCPQDPNVKLEAHYFGRYSCMEGPPACVNTDQTEEFHYTRSCEKIHASDEVPPTTVEFEWDGILCSDLVVWKGGPTDKSYKECGVLRVLPNGETVNYGCYEYGGADCTAPLNEPPTSTTNVKSLPVMCGTQAGRCANTGSQNASGISVPCP